jgi:hypothetical protein
MNLVSSPNSNIVLADALEQLGDLLARGLTFGPIPRYRYHIIIFIIVLFYF